jgi:hypothetical protein
MRPGIAIQHAPLPDRGRDFVRCDVTGLIGFIPRARWPADASAGDFVELVLRRTSELDDHPMRGLFDRTTRRAVGQFFENGGDVCHMFGVCVHDESDLRVRSDEHGPLGPLLARLRAEDDIALLAVPAAAHWRCEVRRSGEVRADVDALYDELLAHCRQMDNRMLLMDVPRGLHGDVLQQWVRTLRDRDPGTRAWGALYYPWLVRGDDVDPPSAAMAGVYARLERQRPPFGISQPPANIAVHGITHTEVELDWAEVTTLGEASINPFVMQPGRGVVVWGARTLSRDPAWIFINTRRIASMVAEQLRRDNEWAVFEPNERSLWKVIERDVAVRLRQFWEAGLIDGPRARPEFSVECNDATNPPSFRDAGMLNVQVSLRPVGTAERISIDLRLGDGG